MTSPTSRVLALLELLQAGGTRTVPDLARRLGVDERTVRRYVAHLADLDVPVRSVRGRHGGIRLERGYRMPPLMLTDEEAVAVTLGLVAARRAGLVTTSAAAAESAAAKLQRVLPAALGRRLAALLETVDVTPVTSPAIAAEARVLLLVTEAARDRRPIRFTHAAAHGQHSTRTVHPYGVVAHSGRWYLTGLDPAIGELRTFRLDRVGAPVVQPGTFALPAGFDPAASVLSALAATPWRYEVVLRVQGAAAEVEARFPPGLATVDDEEEAGWRRVRLRAERLEWVPALLAGLPLPFVVESPEDLRTAVRSLAERLASAAG